MEAEGAGGLSASMGLADQSFDPNAELEDWGPFQPLGEETRSPSGMYDEEDMDGAFLLPACVRAFWVFVDVVCGFGMTTTATT